MVRRRGWESVICNLSYSLPPFKEHWEWPCNATGLHFTQRTWVKPIWSHNPVYIQGVEVYLNPVLRILYSLIWYTAGIYLSTSTISIFLCQLSLSLEPGYVFQILTMAAVLTGVRSLLWSAAVQPVVHTWFLLIPLWAQWRKPLGCPHSSAMPLKPASYTWQLSGHPWVCLWYRFEKAALYSRNPDKPW